MGQDNGKMQRIDDPPGSGAFWQHEFNPDTARWIQDYSDGDTIFIEFDVYKWTWGDFEHKTVNVKIDQKTGDTLDVQIKEEVNHKKVKSGTVSF